MKLFRRIFHPLIAFIGIQLAWILLLVSWIYWFLGRHQELKALAAKYQTEWLPTRSDWLILAEGIVLLIAILAGIYVIFIYWRRQAALVRAQRNFISQVTHELKSPLASLQLHLDTIEMRQPGPQQLQRFVTLMQDDTSRLDGLISNLLTASRFEHKSDQVDRQPGDLSLLVESYLQRELQNFPAQGSLTWQIQENLWGEFEAEMLETMLRNLLENAILYADDAPVVQVNLRREGKMAHLSFADQGQGIDPKYHKKVFRIFYRIRRGDKTIRGSGLGLYIVRNIIRMHGGKIWLESLGDGCGTTFHILLPLTREKQ